MRTSKEHVIRIIGRARLLVCARLLVFAMFYIVVILELRKYQVLKLRARNTHPVCVA